MITRNLPSLLLRQSLPLILLIMFLLALWLYGGASRADVGAQVVVRSVAWGLLIVAILFGNRSTYVQARPVGILLLAAVMLPLLQLLPLPPALWQSLPGRGIFVHAATLAGEAQPWRPWSIVPAATLNAASSMIVPVVTFLLIVRLRQSEQLRLPALFLGFVTVSAVIGLLQFSGNDFDNRLINDVPGELSGLFANRNHFALFTAIGCLMVPIWAFEEGRRPQWRPPVAIALVLLFTLIILASGSRAGIILGVVAIAIGLTLVRQQIRRELRRYPRWVFPLLVLGIVAVIATFVMISVAADRAVSINRVFDVDAGQDMRTRGLPTVFSMIREYFPLGAGLGSFDPIFRVHEPFALLKVTYFNHAHNDFLEILVDAGLPGLLLVGAGLLWWGWASVRAWRQGARIRHGLPELGSAILLLVFIASVFDYPARTPLIMAIVVIAAVWLSGSGDKGHAAALPQADQHL